MKCAYCGCTQSRVVDSRQNEDGTSIRRRRECERCGRRFTTYERREELPLVVVKKDGHREPFDRQKPMRGLITAAVKRDIPLEVLEGVIESIESEQRDSGKTEVTSEEIGKAILKRLAEIDKVAYVRFASVYRDFKDVDEFTEEIRSLSQ